MGNFKVCFHLSKYLANKEFRDYPDVGSLKESSRYLGLLILGWHES